MPAMRVQGIRISWVVLLLLLGLSSPTLGKDAQVTRESELSAEFNGSVTHKEDEGSGGGAPAANPVPGWVSKLEVHGFLTQAYADAKFNDGGLLERNADEQALGIPEDGTFNYRNLALQFRYTISSKDVFVIQFSSRELGDSPLTFVEDEIELDWAFYEHRFLDSTSIKIGRVQIPLGIYNEIRDVGTILPFYRPPFAFYREGSFTSETVDGLVFSHTFGTRSDWSLDFDLWGGEFETVEAARDGSEAALAKTKDAYGVQLWLNTPVPGLRIGAGGNVRTVTEGLFRPPGSESDADEYYASLDATFDRWVVRSEFKVFKPVIITEFFDINLEFPQFYAQFGYSVTDRFQIWLQAEVAKARESSIAFTRSTNRTDRTDYGITFNYSFQPNIVLKAEHHQTESEQVEFFPIVTPFGVLLDPVIFDTDGGNYTIISLSVSF